MHFPSYNAGGLSQSENLKRTPAAHFGGNRQPHMQQGGVLINRGCGLCAPITVEAIEIERGDGMLAECTFESGAAIKRFGCVVSHVFNCSPSIRDCSEHQVRDLRVKVIQLK